MKRLVWVGALLCAAMPLRAQSYYSTIAVTNTQLNGSPVTTPASSGYISVCTVISPTSCTAATIYSDQAMTQVIGQPFQADRYGSFGFWAATAVYQYQLCLPTGCRSYTLPTGSGSATITVNGATANGFVVSSSGGNSPTVAVGTDSTHVLPINNGSATTYLNGAGQYSTPSGSAPFPSNSALVVNTSTTAARNATTGDVSSLLQGASGCTTSGYVYSPVSNTCVAPGAGSGISTLTSDVTASGTGSVAATVVGVHATAGTLNGVTIGATTPAAITGTTVTAAELGNMLYASQTPAATNLKFYTTMSGSSNAAVVADPSLGSGDRLGYINGQIVYAAGSPVSGNGNLGIDTRAGSFNTFHYNWTPGPMNQPGYASGPTCIVEGQTRTGGICSGISGYALESGYSNGNGPDNDGGWDGDQMESSYFFGVNAGIDLARTYTFNAYGVGDKTLDQRNAEIKPGMTATSDEGVDFSRDKITEALPYIGAVAGNTLSGTDALLSLSTTYNADKLGVGHPVLDETYDVQSGTVTMTTIPTGAGQYAYATTSFTLPVSTPVTLLTTIAIPNAPLSMAQTYAATFAVSTSASLASLVNDKMAFEDGHYDTDAVLTAAATPAAWASGSAYTAGQFSAVGAEAYIATIASTGQSPANSLVAPVGLSLLQNTGSGTLNITLSSAGNLVNGANVVLAVSGGAVGCSGLSGTYTVQSNNGTTSAVLAGASGGYLNCGAVGTAKGAWTQLGSTTTAPFVQVLTANVRHDHYAGITAYVGGAAGRWLDFAITDVTAPYPGVTYTMRYPMLVFGSPTATSIVGGFEGPGLINNDAGFPWASGPFTATLYHGAHAAAISPVITCSGGRCPLTAGGTSLQLAGSEPGAFAAGDTIEEQGTAVQNWGQVANDYLVYDPMASVSGPSYELDGNANKYGDAATWGFRFDNNTPSTMSYGVNIVGPFFTGLSLSQAPSGALASVVTSGGLTSFDVFNFNKGGGHNLNFNLSTNTFNFEDSSLMASQGFSFVAPDLASSQNTAQFSTQYAGYPIANFTEASTHYADPIITISGSSNFDDGTDAIPFSPSVLFSNTDSTNQPWAFGVADSSVSGMNGAYVLAYNPLRSGSSQTETVVEDCTVTGTCNFPLGLQEAGAAVCTATNGVCPGSGGGASFPSTPAIVVNTSTTAARNATTGDMSTLLQTATGCTTAGNVYSPETNTCIGASGATLSAANVFTQLQTVPLVENGPVYDIRAYGAHSDGTTDDTAAVQATISAAQNSGYTATYCGSIYYVTTTDCGAILQFPAGTTVVSQLSLTPYLTLRGTGEQTTILLQKAGTSGHMIVLSSATTSLRDVVEDMDLNGNAANQTTANDGIHFDNTDAAGDRNHQFRNLRIENFSGWGMDMLGSFGEDTGDNIALQRNQLGGLYQSSPDSKWTNITSQLNNGPGVDFAGDNEYISHSKTFYNGANISAEYAACTTASDGVVNTGSRNRIIDVEAQDNCADGFAISGDSVTVTADFADGNGKINYPNSTQLYSGFNFGALTNSHIQAMSMSQEEQGGGGYNNSLQSWGYNFTNEVSASSNNTFDLVASQNVLANYLSYPNPSDTVRMNGEYISKLQVGTPRVPSSSTAPQTSYQFQICGSYLNASSAVAQDCPSMQVALGTGTTPAYEDWQFSPSSISPLTYFTLEPQVATTSSVNSSSVVARFLGGVWTTAAHQSSWTIQNVMSAGTTPVSTLQFTSSTYAGTAIAAFNTPVSATALTSTGSVTAAQYLGPATAPTGSCATNGAWVFSQDGHATFCNAGTWATKI